MRICVFGAASNEIDNKYISAVENMAQLLAKRGHNLVFGAGAGGLMGAAARGFKNAGAQIIGVIPHFFKEANIEAIYRECDELIYTDSMRERKAVMEDKADAFIIVPGGIGTFEEFFEVLTLKQLARHDKPIAVFNIANYYDEMEEMMKQSVEKGFLKEACGYLYDYFDDAQSLAEYIEKNKKYNLSIDDVKNS